MVEIATISHGASSGLLYNIHYIARSVLCLIGEDQRIATQDEEASTSHGPSIRPPVSSIAVRMQLIRGRGRGRGGDLVPDLGACLPRRPRTPRTRQVVPPSSPLAPSTPSNPFEITHAPTDHLAVYSRCPKRKTKPSSCETH